MLSNCGRSRKISFRMASPARTFVFLTIYIALFAYMTNGEKYPNKYDDIDVDEILANPRLRNQYVGCIMNSTPCLTGAARLLRDNFADAFITKCTKCTEKQVVFFGKVTEWFTTNEPETWNRAVRVALQKIQNKNI